MQQLHLEKNQYYWIKDGIKEYLPALLLDDPKSPHDKTENLRFEIFESRGREVISSYASVFGRIPNPASVHLRLLPDDLVNSADISEQSILWSLEKRFTRDSIYSAIGPILIALNPYTLIENLYSASTLQHYIKTQLADPITSLKMTSSNPLPPHVWIIAHNAYSQLRERGARQAIIISGESGAGKTEATKKCLQYLSAMSSLNDSMSIEHSNNAGTNGDAIEDRVLGTNPLLESFGNSKTARNNNSSRFGKWLTIHFSRASETSALRLNGAYITQYLLEKSRVVFQSKDERNYHIFYQLFADDSLNLGNPAEYNFLNQSGSVYIEGVDDAEEYRSTLAAFRDLKFQDSHKEAILFALKAILLIGNVQFEEDSSGTKIKTVEGKETTATDSEPLISQAANLLGFQSTQFALALTVRTMKVRSETVSMQMDMSQAIDSRNTLCKEIYGRLFADIVKQCNHSLHPKGGGFSSGRQNDLSIGLLDIFGFEIFEKNSFEQICINYANEKLQQYFLSYVLKKEQEVYINEGIPFQKIVPRDNEDVLALIESKPEGIFARLEEELKVPKGTDLGFLKKVEKDHGKKVTTSSSSQRGAAKHASSIAMVESTASSPTFLKDIKMKPTEFKVQHFAGTVLYDCAGFMEKNRDKLHEQLEDLLSSSTVSQLKLIFKSSPSNTGNSSPSATSSTVPTITTKFQFDLNQLMTTLNESDAHFIRCIKPNADKLPRWMDNGLVLQQLRYSGVLEAIQIRKSGYSSRRSHRDFKRNYWMVAKCNPEALKEMSDSLASSSIVSALAARDPAHYSDIIVGKSLVFYKPDTAEKLETEKLVLITKAVLFTQRYWRGRVVRKKCKILSNTRNHLRSLIARGNELNRCNVSILDELVLYLQFSIDEVQLNCSVLRDAEESIERLSIVWDCKEKIKLRSINQTKYDDVAAEYSTCKSIHAEAIALGILPEELLGLNAKLNSLKERAEGIISLKTAVAICDDDIIKRSLRVIQMLKGRYGDFCPDEESLATRLLDVISKETNSIEQCFEITLNYHRNCRFSESKSSSNNNNTVVQIESNNLPVTDLKDEWENFISVVNSLDEEIATILGIYDTGDLDMSMDSSISILVTLAEIDVESDFLVPRSLVIKSVLAVFQQITSNHNILMSEEWSLLAFNISQMSSFCSELLTNISDGISNNSKQRLATLSKIVESEVVILRKILEHYWLLPMVVDSINSGRAVPNASDPSFPLTIAAIDCEDLMLSLREVRNILIDGQAITMLFPRLDMLVAVRMSCIQSEWGDVLYFTQNRKLSALRRRRYNLLCEKLTEFLNRVDPNAPPLFCLPTSINEETEDELSTFTMMPWEAAQELLPQYESEYLGVAIMVEEEIRIIRHEAMDRYIQHLYSQALCIGTVNVMTSAIAYQGALVINAHLVTTDHFSMTANEIQVLMFENTWYSTSKSVKSLTDAFHAVFTLRNYAITGQWIDILKGVEKTDVIPTWLTSNGDDEEIFLSEAFTDIVRTVISEARQEIHAITIVAQNNIAYSKLSGSLKIGGIRGVFTTLHVDSGEIETLETLLNEILHEHNLNFSDLTIALQDLISLVKVLIPARKAFGQIQRSDLMAMDAGIGMKRLAWSDLMECVEAVGDSNMPVELGIEISLMKDNLELSESMSALYEALALPTPVLYVVANPQGRAQSMSMSMPTRSAKNSMLTIDSAAGALDEDLSSDHNDEDEASSLFSSGEFNIIIERLLSEEGLILNDEILDIRPLQVGLAASDEVIQKFGIACDYPEDFKNLRTAANHMMKIRNFVTEGKWVEVSGVLQQLEDSRFVDSMPIIRGEIRGVTDLINSYLIISICKSAASKGSPTMSYSPGRLDIGPISVKYLAKAIDVCNTIGCKSLRAELLVEGLSLLIRLRECAMDKDWNSLTECLDKVENNCASNSVGNALKSICPEEVLIYKSERDHHDCTSSIRHAIIEEEIAFVHSSIDFKCININKLSNAIQSATQRIPEAKRGKFIVTLLSLAQIILKFRRAAIQQQWSVLQSLIAAVDNELFTFVNDLDKIGSSKVVRHRQSSIMLNPKPLRKSVVTSPPYETNQVDISTSNPMTDIEKTNKEHELSNSASDEFQSLTMAIKRELGNINQHFDAIDLEQDAIRALSENGLNIEAVGEIDLSTIRKDALKILLDTKMKMDARSFTLSDGLQNLMIAVSIIYDCRSAILENRWEVIPNLLDDCMGANKSILIESSRLELRAIRAEVENRWIINNIRSALQQGRLEGAPGEVKLGSVTADPLVSCLDACKALKPRTPLALMTVYTGEVIFPLRRLLCDHPINWALIKECSENLQSPKNLSMLHESVLPELKLILITAEDHLVIELMTSALSTGGTTGIPGDINFSSLTVDKLNMICQPGCESSVKTEKAKAMLRACKSIKIIRETLLRINVFYDYGPKLAQAEEDEKGNFIVLLESWKTLRTTISKVYEDRDKSHSLSLWPLFREEVILITREAHIQEIRESIESSVRKSAPLYKNRNSLSVGQLNQHGSILMTGDTELNCDDLSKIINHASKFDFDCKRLQAYVDCARELLSLRQALIQREYATLETLIQNAGVIKKLEVIGATLREFNLIKREHFNKYSIDLLNEALYSKAVVPASTGVGDSGGANRVIYQNIGSGGIISEEKIDFLLHTIERVESYEMGSVAVQELVECAKYLYLLRSGLFRHNDDDITFALTWFKHQNNSRLPIQVQHETNNAYCRYQNALLESGFIKALSEGKAAGSRGNIDYSNLLTSELQKLLNQSKDIKELNESVTKLIEAAEIVFVIRSAQLEKDYNKLKNALKSVSNSESLHPLIVEEVASARAELDNEISLSALTEALRAFDDNEAGLLSTHLDSSINSYSNYLIKPIQTNKNATTPTKNLNTISSPPAQSPRLNYPKGSRRYSYANINSMDIDLGTIDLKILDDAMTIAKEHGIFTAEGRRLFRTVQVIRSLREHMKLGNWSKVDEILFQLNVDDSMGSAIDTLAEKELLVIKMQLHLHRSIIDLSNALGKNWARCYNGVVSCSDLSTTELLDTVSKAEKHLANLFPSEIDSKLETTQISPMFTGRDVAHVDASSLSRSRFINAVGKIGSSTMSTSPRTNSLKDILPLLSKKSPRKNIIFEQTELLLRSSKRVIEVRELLKQARFEAAGALAEVVLREEHHHSVENELNLYIREISKSIQLHRMYYLLKENLDNRQNLGVLRDSITEACNFSYSTHSNPESESIPSVLQPTPPTLTSNNVSEFPVIKDLGLVKIVVRATKVLKKYISYQDKLRTIDKCTDAEEIKKILTYAKNIGIEGSLLNRGTHRLEKIKEFETLVNGIKTSCNGVIASDEQSMQLIVELGNKYNLRNHSMVTKAKTLLKLSPAALQTVIIAESISLSKPHAAVTKSMQLKHAYLFLDSSRQKYSLLKFPNLRNLSEFQDIHSLLLGESTALVTAATTAENLGQENPMNLKKLKAAISAASAFKGISIASAKLAQTNAHGITCNNKILSHSKKTIPTSLTSLPPALAALSVWIFAQSVRGIERNIYTTPALQLRNLILLGRECPKMREEIYLQITKQINNNPDSVCVDRLWRVMGACLSHFPPSKLLENYLELYFIIELELPLGVGSPAAKKCIRLLHESVFYHGYDSVITSQCDITLKTLGLWLSDAYLPTLQLNTSMTSGTLIDSKENQQIGSNNHDPSAATAGTGMSNVMSSDSISMDVGDIVEESEIKGSRENWIKRFGIFMSHGSDDGGHKAGARGGKTSSSSSTFIPSFSDANATASSSRVYTADDTLTGEMFLNIMMDYIRADGTSSKVMEEASGEGKISHKYINEDLDILLYLIFGSTKAEVNGALVSRLHRELMEDQEVFHFQNEVEISKSLKRRTNFLKHIVTPAPRSHKNKSSSKDKAEASKSLLLPSYTELSDMELFVAINKFWVLVASSNYEHVNTTGGNVIIGEGRNVRRVSISLDSTATADYEMSWDIFHDLIMAGTRIYLMKHQETEQTGRIGHISNMESFTLHF